MRRQHLVSLTFAATAVMSMSLGASPTVADDTAAHAAPTVTVQRVHLPGQPLRDEVAMVLVGSALIGAAAAVRRAA
jgi:hypothetical protein